MARRSRIRLAELRAIVHSTLRALADSTRLEDVHRVEDIVSRDRFTVLAAAATTDEALAALLRERPELDAASVDFDALRQLPQATLGRAYVDHLERNNLELYTTQTSDEFIDDPDVRYLIHRYRQAHDVWHVLLGLGVRGHEEVLVHAFTYGHLRIPISAMIITLGGIKHLVLERRWQALRRGLWENYTVGRDAAPLLSIHWEQQWTRPLAELRAQLRVRPCAPEFYAD
ncbi:MAG: hypothetical protein KC636_26470 [Myxococcales bacterium]|nr:hypothetical protein [Myxococcales bacterium]